MCNFVEYINEMELDNNILKINRHLFDNGTSKINRVLRNFVPRGSTPRSRWLQQCLSHTQWNNGKVKNRVEIFKLNLRLQGKGYRLGNLFKLNLTSLIFGVLYLFNSLIFKTI